MNGENFYITEPEKTFLEQPVLESEQTGLEQKGIRLKTEAELEAQVGVFSSEAKEENIFNEDQPIRKLLAEGIVKISHDKIKNEPEYQAYLEYLRKVKGSKHEPIKRRVEVLNRYSDFEPAITKLQAELNMLNETSDHPDFLGNGSSSNVFRIKIEDKEYAVRITEYKEDLENYLSGLVLGLNIEGLEQIVATSYGDGITVSEVVPGKPIVRLTAAEIDNITINQLKNAMNSVINGYNKGIEFDFNSGNILYHEDSGFSFIDYSSIFIVGETIERSLGSYLNSIILVIYSISKRNYKEQTELEREEDLLKRIEVTSRFLTKCLILIELLDLPNKDDIKEYLLKIK